MPCEIPHWSYSSINQFLRCPRQFFFQRILGLPIRTITANQVLGTAVHAALATYHRGIRDGQDASPDLVESVYLNVWENETQLRKVASRDGRNVADAIDCGRSLIDCYLKEPPPEGIDSIESLFVAPIVNSSGEYLKRPLHAIADLTTLTSGELTIHEFKTLARSMSQEEADSALQATCYTHVVRELFGQESTVEYVCLVKTKTPKIKRLTTARSEGRAGQLGDLVQSIERAITAEAFFPIESPFNCSGCPYRAPCRDWGDPTPSETVDLSIGSLPSGC